MRTEGVAALVGELAARGLSIATAESLTGGALVARLVDIPGASRVVRGGVCTYATDTKASVLSVSRERLELTGPVDAEVAKQMASGARALFGADIALSTTGVAGPGSADGHEAGTVHVACAGPGARCTASSTYPATGAPCAREPWTPPWRCCARHWTGGSFDKGGRLTKGAFPYSPPRTPLWRAGPAPLRRGAGRRSGARQCR